MMPKLDLLAPVPTATALAPVASIHRKMPVAFIASQGPTSDSELTANRAVTLTRSVVGTTVRVFNDMTSLGVAVFGSISQQAFSKPMTDRIYSLDAVMPDRFDSRDTTSQPTPAIFQPTPPQPPSTTPQPTPIDVIVPVVALKYETQVVGSNVVDLWGTVTGPAGTQVEIYSGATDLGAATITGTTWHFATTSPAAGNYSYTAVATTTAGGTATYAGLPSLTVGTPTGTLDPTQFQTVWQQDFTTTTAVDRTIFPILYGTPDQFSFGTDGITLTSYRAQGWTNVGILQENWDANLAQGYGLYSVTASHPANQGGGIAILLWPSNNVWPGPEIDLVEDWNDPTSQTATMSVHFRGPNGQDTINSIKYTVDLTVPNTFSMDWERGSLSYYVNGNLIVQITGSEVPLSAADGGVNSSFGVQITDIGTNPQPSDIVSLTIADISYSAPIVKVAGPKPAIAGAFNSAAFDSAAAMLRLNAAVPISNSATDLLSLSGSAPLSLFYPVASELPALAGGSFASALAAASLVH